MFSTEDRVHFTPVMRQRGQGPMYELTLGLVLVAAPGGDQRTTDPRGFDRLAWLGLSKAPKAAGGG